MSAALLPSVPKIEVTNIVTSFNIATAKKINLATLTQLAAPLAHYTPVFSASMFYIKSNALMGSHARVY